MKHVSIGVDIGACEVKFALCDAGAVRRLVSVPVPDQLVREGRIVSPEAMSGFLKETAAKYHISGRRCAVVLPATAAFTRRSTLPAMSAEQLKLNLPYEFRDYITQSKDEYVYDYALLDMARDEIGAPKQMELLACAALKANVQSYMDMFRRAGFRLELAMPEEFAYAALLRRHIAANPDQANAEYCFIDLGHSATRVQIYTGSRFEVSRVVDYGGAALDAAIAGDLNIDEHLAHTYKLANHNDCLTSEACQNVYAAIALEIMRAVNFYGYNNPNSALSRAWLCGGGARNAVLVQRLRESVSLELHPISELLPPGGEEETQALCPVAIGITQ